MGQQCTKSTHKQSISNKPIKQRPDSLNLQSLLPQPSTVNPTNEQTSNSRQQLTLSLSLNSNCSLSPAELYILSRSQISPCSNDQQDISPVTPSSVTPSLAKSTTTSLQCQKNHAQVMRQWHENKASEINKKQKHRYTYGPPVRTSMSSDNHFVSPVCSTTSTQANSSLQAERKKKQSSIPSSHMNLPVKTDTLTIKNTERSRTNESCYKTRMSTAV